jgi:ferredoxin
MAYFITDACTGCTACARICPTTAIHGERKALHVIEEEVCIECGACGRICPYNAILTEERQPAPMVKRALWLKPTVDHNRCVSCGACIQACPVSVLAFDDSAGHKPHLIPYLKDEKNCIGCSFCDIACPVDAIHMGVLEAVPA